ncbi:MAG: HRDC domain-containing protein [Candidatus Brocadiae bacterium]|nr:HRDC domain-containing protein [Candidatus Brocadiia bacterium]
MISFKTILLPYQSSTGCFDETELQLFLESESPNILNYQSQFFTIQGNPCWSILLVYEKKTQQRIMQSNLPKISSTVVAPVSQGIPQDNSPVPNTVKPEHQELYRYMREWRRVNAHKDHVPAYRYCSDHQMGVIVETQPETMEELKRVSGLHANQIEKYGKAILDALKNAPCQKTSKQKKQAAEGVPGKQEKQNAPGKQENQNAEELKTEKQEGEKPENQQSLLNSGEQENKE